MKRTVSEMVRDLAEHLPELNRVILEALRKYKTGYAELAHNHSPRSQSSIINDLMRIEAVARFGNRPGVNIVKRRGTVLIDFASMYSVKLKKLDRAKRARFTETQTALAFARQLGDLNGQTQLQVGEPATNLFAGYVLHPVEMLKSAAWVVCPNGRRVEWSYEIVRHEAVAPVTLLRQSTGAERKRSRVRAKLTEAEKKKADNGPRNE